MTSTLETRPAPAPAAGRSTREVRVAIIGSGFAGLGMAIALKKRGENDFVVLERADDVGGTWRDNTYPGRGLRRAVQPLLVLLRAEPRLAALLLRAAGDPGLPAGHHRPLRRPRALRLRRRRHLGPMAREGPALGGPDAGRQLPRPGARLRRRRAGRPDLSRHPGPGHIRRHRHALRPLGLRARPHRREGRRHRHRRIGHPGRARHPADRRQRRGLPADAGLGGPPHRPPGEADDAAAVPVRARAAEGRAVGPVPVPRVPGHRPGQAAPLPQARRASSPRPTCTARSATPSCGRR